MSNSKRVGHRIEVAALAALLGATAVACSLDLSGLASTSHDQDDVTDGKDPYTADGSHTEPDAADVPDALVDATPHSEDANDGGVVDAPVHDVPDAGAIDYFVTSWDAEWWSAGGNGSGQCDWGDAFNDLGEITIGARATSTETLLSYPRADHSSWTAADGRPAANVSKEFCGRFEAELDLPSGDFTLAYSRDDGVRVYVDGVRIVNDWTMAPTNNQTVLVPWTNQSAGAKKFRILYRDTGGDARLKLTLKRN